MRDRAAAQRDAVDQDSVRDRRRRRVSAPAVGLSWPITSVRAHSRLNVGRRRGTAIPESSGAEADRARQRARRDVDGAVEARGAERVARPGRSRDGQPVGAQLHQRRRRRSPPMPSLEQAGEARRIVRSAGGQRHRTAAHAVTRRGARRRAAARRPASSSSSAPVVSSAKVPVVGARWPRTSLPAARERRRTVRCAAPSAAATMLPASCVMSPPAPRRTCWSARRRRSRPPCRAASSPRPRRRVMVSKPSADAGIDASASRATARAACRPRPICAMVPSSARSPAAVEGQRAAHAAGAEHRDRIARCPRRSAPAVASPPAVTSSRPAVIARTRPPAWHDAARGRLQHHRAGARADRRVQRQVAGIEPMMVMLACRRPWPADRGADRQAARSALRQPKAVSKAMAPSEATAFGACVEHAPRHRPWRSARSP